MSITITLPSGQVLPNIAGEPTVEEAKELLSALYPDVAGSVGTEDAEGNIKFARPVGGTKG